jgi:hypothetical protein
LRPHRPSYSHSGWQTSDAFQGTSSAYDTQSRSPSAFTSYAICTRRIGQTTSSS